MTTIARIFEYFCAGFIAAAVILAAFVLIHEAWKEFQWQRKNKRGRK